MLGKSRLVSGYLSLLRRDHKKRLIPDYRTARAELRDLMTTIHRMNSERYVGDSKLHEMVAIAMEEDWESCVAHMETITGTIGGVIAEGAASGEFDVADVPLAAMCACTAMMRFFHPQMIAQCVDKPGPLDRPDDRFCRGGTCLAC